MTPTARSLRALFAALFAASLPPSLASAASHTWGGLLSGGWSIGVNWTSGGAPMPNETGVVLVFPAGQQHMDIMVNDVTGLNVTSITIGDSAYVISGNAISLNGSIGTFGPGGLAYAFATFGLPITLTGPATFVADGNHQLSLDGVISGAFPITTMSTNGPTGVVRLSGANSYSGVTTIASGYLFVRSNTALGAGDGTPATGTVVSPGGTIDLVTATITNEALSIGGTGANGNGTIQSEGLSPNAWSGPITLTSNVTVNAGTGSSLPLVLDGVISGPFGMTLTATAASPVTLTKANTYGGTTTIQAGVVFVMGSQPASAVVVASPFFTNPSVLRGTGSVGAVTLGNGSGPQKSIQAGTSAAKGILTCLGLDLSDQNVKGRVAARLDGTAAGSGYDQLAVNGPVSLGSAALEVTFGYSPAPGDTYTIIANDGADSVNGTFSSLPEGAVFGASGKTLQISYHGGDGNDVVLTVLCPTDAAGPTVAAPGAIAVTQTACS